ncbi:MAG TPA: HU family DNA-binding protein [Spirochaetota bacterium]|nr:HU family DNA-binding protein [Spirochaetota bacterium]HOM38748.1 HU family DNA-binding protein [Spirochaetota bacterium]HPQ49546.1 HU family DNA-binding protein [Spirochaetota bacterium]
MSASVNKKDIVSLIFEKIKQENPEEKITKKEIEMIVDSTVDVLCDSLKQGKKVSLIGFGSFTVKERKATLKTNPKDPSKKIKVPAKKLVRFKASDKLNDSIN